MNTRDFKIACCVAALTAMPLSASYAEEEKIGEGTTADNAAPVYALDAVVVTANRTPQKITETNADISVVTRQEIETMHMQNVEEALRIVPGVQFLSYGATNLDHNMNAVRINGSKDIVVLVDGVRTSAFQSAGDSGNMNAPMLKNMDNIERIEVLRGAAATVYGSGAKGGVINIITRKADKTETTVDVSHGAFGRQNYNVNTQGKADKLSYTAYYGYNQQGDVKDPNGLTWEGDSKSRSGGFSLSYAFNDKSNLSLMYNHTKTTYDAYDPWYNQDFRDSTYETTDITLRHQYRFSDLWKNELTYRRNKVDSQLNLYRAGSDTISPWMPPTKYTYYFWSDQVTYTSDKHTIVAGFDWAKSQNRYKDSGAQEAPDKMSNMSVYVQDDWKILPKLTLSGGVRYDKPNNEGGVEFESHTSKSYKLSYELTKKDTIYAGRSDFFILPSIYQVSDPQYGNPALRPSYGRTSSIGYTRIFSDRNSLMLSWFYTKSDETITYDMSGQYQNKPNEVARGWNAQWNSRLDQHWDLNLGWSHLYQKVDGDTFYLGYEPKDLATIGIYYHSGKWSGGLDGFYFIRRMDGVDKSKKGWPADKYGVFNLSVNYQATKNLGVYAKVENIFNKLWGEQTQAIWGNPGEFYTQPRRNMTIGMQYKF